ncbi:LAMI_0B06150g1_1 [Lachancea mirantina]|uniref:LAMI_0B06150g1_1 n=1 Tax=Lachancea mirantina TaxID=1230905 RepID=A0A1G4IX22_9SACH|nr:LAMI_0B06150g1_1 [Lachancea mirantina]
MVHLGFLLFFCAAVPRVLGANTYTDLGCYKASDLESSLESKGQYQYQSRSYCEQQCSGSTVVALVGGDTCYCGNSVSIFGSISSQDSSQCNTNCDGWPYETCGGSGYMEVLVLQGTNVPSGSSSSGSRSSTTSSSSSSSSSTSSTSSSSSSSTSNPSSSSLSSSSSSSSLLSSSSSTTSSSSSPSSTSSSSSSSSLSTQSSSSSSTSTSSSSGSTGSSSETMIVTTASVSVVTLSNSGRSTVIVTATTVVNSTPTGQTANSKDTKRKSGLSGGSIAGIVVGVVCGAILVAAIVFFLLWRRRKQQESDMEETKQHQPYSFGDAYHDGSSTGGNVPSERLQGEDISLSEDLLRPSAVFADNFGRLRLSNGSLPHVVPQAQARPLRIVNPDSDEDSNKEDDNL